MSKPFKLSACLYGHSLDVRSLAVTAENSIISGSRDKTAKFWKPNGFNTSFCESVTYREQKNFVGAVLFLEPTKEFPEGLVLTGGNDNIILVYKPSEPFATYTIKEHTNSVSCLANGILPNSFLSGSWDTSAKYWCLDKSQSSVSTMSGHVAAIWSVLQLHDSRVVTASADKTIGLWNLDGILLQTLKGHTDCVRGLCDIPELNFFISVSNDATIKTWSYSGENLNTYYGHTHYIYSVARCKAGGENCFITSDEDRTVRLWKEGINTETFQIPAQSIWAISCLSNGDIVTGSSDGVVRIFTQHESRFADPPTLHRFEEEVTALTKQKMQEIGGYKVSDLPGKEALYDPGKRAGQMKMIREGHGVVAYKWVEADDKSHWEKVGDVLGATDKSNEGKTMFEGKGYDYVFTVDVEDGKPPLKLPFNKGEDPYSAAQAFLDRNNLPPVYLEQVVEFIFKNSNEQSVSFRSDYVDPFTGGSRYTPTAGNDIPTVQGANLDPFTGSSSYSTGASNQSSNFQVSSGMNSDPFTGGMSYTTKVNQEKSYFPQNTYLVFEMGDPNVILNKLKEFNQKLGDVGKNADEKCLEEFITLCAGSPPDLNLFDILFKLLEWPEDLVFPVLDVVRMAVRHSKNNEIISTVNSDLLIEKLKFYISENCSIANNTIVALRTFSNLCLHNPGENLVFEHRFDIVENVTSLGGLSKNGQIALSTLLLNMSILMLKKNDELGITVLADVIQDMLTKLTDPESQFRAYVALGTLITPNTPESKEIKIKLKTNSSFITNLQEHITMSNNELERKRMNCAKDIQDILL